MFPPTPGAAGNARRLPAHLVRFGTLTIGDTVAALDAGDRLPTDDCYVLHELEPAVEFGRSPSAATVANGVMAMVLLLDLRPEPPAG